MTDPELKQSILDAEHLRLLSIGHFISAGVSAFFSLFGLVYMFMGVMMGAILSSAVKTGQHADAMPPQVASWMFGIFGGVFFLFGAGMAIAKFLTGNYLRQRRSRTFCQVVAGISCLSIPFGTALGVATFLTLGKPSVSGLFDRSTADGTGSSRASA